MASAKQTAAAAEHSGQAAHNPLGRTLGTALAGAGLTLLLGTGIALYGQGSGPSASALAGLLGSRQAALVEQQLGDWQAALASAAGDPALLSALQSGERPAVAGAQQSLRLRFPGALALELVPLGPLGVAGLQSDALPGTSVLELNLISQAVSGSAVKPEAFGSGRQVALALVQPVLDADRKVVGAILLRQPASALQSRIALLEAGQGSTRLVQKFGQNELVLAEHGQRAGDAPTASLSLNGGSWSLAFTPGEAALEPLAPPLWPVLAASGIWAAGLFGLLGWVYRRTGGLYRDDLLKLAQLLQQLSNRPDSSPPNFTLAEFAPLGESALAVSRRALEGATPVANARRVEVPAAASMQVEEAASPAPVPAAAPAVEVPEGVFRAYDIRGRVDAELTPELARLIGRAIGSECQEQGQYTVVVGRDGRLSSPALAEALCEGLADSGVDVLELGQVPTPVVYFATHSGSTQSGVMVTGSHNPKDQNGFKIVIAGRTLAGDRIAALRNRIVAGDFRSGVGNRTQAAVVEDYIGHILSDIAIAHPLKLVLDAGNGVAGGIAPRLFGELGCEVVPLFCEVDGNFPNHHPDPGVAANLEALIERVRAEDADIGIAFDGDGDRLAVVTRSGRIVPADRLLMLFAQDVVSRNPGADVLFDVKCSRRLNGLISGFGGRPIMWKSGHSYMKEKMRETGALLGGEFSGHIFFGERWFGFDDGLYAAARLVEIVSISGADLDDLMATFPATIASDELRVAVPDADKFRLIESLASRGQFGDGKPNTLDGLRVEFSDGWGLVRASNTEAAITLRFEGDSREALDRIQGVFREQIQAQAPGVQLPL